MPLLTSPTNLLSPFIGPVLPKRFDLDNDNKTKWSYMGREKFKELLHNLHQWKKNQYSRATAALRNEGIWKVASYGRTRVLSGRHQGQNCLHSWLPRAPIPYVQAAMLFAWADNDDLLREIVRLDTCENINQSFKCRERSIFVIDQMNTLAKNQRNPSWYGNRYHLHYPFGKGKEPNISSMISTTTNSGHQKDTSVHNGCSKEGSRETASNNEGGPSVIVQ